VSDEDNEDLPELPNEDNENPPVRPTRHRKRWSIIEDNELIVEISEGQPWDEIARKHSRTEGAVILHALELVKSDRMEIVRKTATGEDFRRPPKDPKFDPKMSISGVGIPPRERYDVIRHRDGKLWYSFYMPE
jgi:hypothetical protein